MQFELPTPSTESSCSEGHLSDSDTSISQYEDDKVADIRPSELFAENIYAKVTRVGFEFLKNNNPPQQYPEFVPQSGPDKGKYVTREIDFWTCGFFPGTIMALLERAVKYPKTMTWTKDIPNLRTSLRSLAHSWSEPLHRMANRTDTHDIGFIMMPALKLDWELTHNEKSLRAIITSAHSLASRYDPEIGAIRSWDLLIKQDIEIKGTENFLVIIDSMCNLDLLFYAASHSSDESLADVAISHALTVIKTHLRPQTVKGSGYEGQLYSTTHVVNVGTAGQVRQRLTGQGYSPDSTWSRGQAWAILGFSQSYHWTKDKRFLDAACGVAEYFLYRLEKTSPLVPVWDFDAPSNGVLRDTSAGLIAANGMLLLTQALLSLGQAKLANRFCRAAISIVSDTVELSLAPKESFADASELKVERFDALVKNATANWNGTARRRYCDHGLVYGDYYLITSGNKMLELGLC